MASSKRSPFLFKEMAGTSWHKRFSAEEFQIILNNYPERKIMIDSFLSERELQDSERLETYQSLLIDYLLKNNQLDEKMPIEILKDLRSLRNEHFGKNLCRYNDKSYTDSNVRLSYYQSDLELRKKLESELSKVEKILYIPGKPGSFKNELILLTELTDAEILVACSDDPLLCSVTEKMFDELHSQKRFSSVKKDLSLSFPLYSAGIEILKDFQDSGTFIFTTNIWLYLEIFRDMKDFGFILNNTEWFSRGLLQHSFERTADNLLGFNSSAYTDMHLNLKVDNGITLAGYQRYYFPHDINVSGVQYNALSLPAFLREEFPKPLASSMQEKIREFNEGCDSITVSTGVYRIEKSEVTETGLSDPEAVLVSLVTAEEQKVISAPLFFYTNVPPEATRISKTGVLVSFNYYFTENLVKYYNNLVSEKEQLHIKNFFIDYLSVEVHGKRFETLPLYNKAFLGCTKKGEIFAGHFIPAKVDLFIEDNKYSFSEAEINPSGDGSAVGIYLPSSGRESVGPGKNCLVMVQDQIIFHGVGPCAIPPVGSVVVMEKVILPVGDTVRFNVSWKNMPYSSDDIKWLVGGFNLLVEKGINLYSSITEAGKNLEYEGWSSTSSKMTQETQLDPGVRQPRAVFGRTKTGRLLLVQFSGRTSVSSGSTFKETITFVQHMMDSTEELDFLINLDGGASASIIGHKEGTYTNFSLTAPSETNPAGVARRLPVYFSITSK